jgi:hypothetical protein
MMAILPYVGPPWFLAAMVAVVYAIIIDHRINKATGVQNPYGLRKSNLIGNTFGGNPGEPEEIKAMRRKLRWVLAVAASGLVLMAAIGIAANPLPAKG